MRIQKGQEGGPERMSSSPCGDWAWRSCLLSMKNMYTLLIEVGGGKPLSGLNREQDRLRGSGGSCYSRKRGSPSFQCASRWESNNLDAITPATPPPPQEQDHTIWVKEIVGPLWSSKRSMVLRLRIMCKP